jgi:hypothetical protein
MRIRSWQIILEAKRKVLGCVQAVHRDLLLLQRGKHLRTLGLDGLFDGYDLLEEGIGSLV